MADYPKYPNNATAEQLNRWANVLTDKLGSDALNNRNNVKLDVDESVSLNGRIRLNANLTNPDTTGAFQKGQIRFNASTNKFQGYDGTGWRDFH